MLPINDMTLYCLYSVFHSNSVVVYLSCCHYYITSRVCRTRGNLPKGITCVIHGYLHNLYLHCIPIIIQYTYILFIIYKFALCVDKQPHTEDSTEMQNKANEALYDEIHISSEPPKTLIELETCPAYEVTK